MDKNFKLSPKSSHDLTPPEILINNLQSLVGKPFPLSGKPRTDGSNLRKLIASTLEKFKLPDLASPEQYEIVPPKGKGVPKIRREFIDTYIVTTGESYNLQVWNRLPASNTLLVKYESGDSLKCSDVRFVLVKIDIDKKIISSVVLLTSDYIENKFGRFGKSTVKSQLLISAKARKKIYEREDKIQFFADTKKLSYYTLREYIEPDSDILTEPSKKSLFSINILKELVAEKLIGQKLDSADTKTRGQSLERKVLDLLGYKTKNNGLLCGGFPDIPNQLLEVKVQDSCTVDLGRFSPEKEELVFDDLDFTTFDVRYLIALTNPKTQIIEGIILSSGSKLGELFSYVSSESYKCQRSIPMSFFEKYNGKCVFNPD